MKKPHTNPGMGTSIVSTRTDAVIENVKNPRYFILQKVIRCSPQHAHG
jgi:hypothetical protein